MTVNILGTPYEIVKESYTQNKVFKERCAGGYIEFYRKRITICDMKTFEGWEYENAVTIQEAEKQNLRHEIVHAFLFESGLHDNSTTSGGWAVNEEMVDWIAINGLKIYKAWQEMDCL